MERTANDDGKAPAAAVIAAAEQTNLRLGHENHGHLSFAHGFMPAGRPLLALPAAFAAWDQLAAELPRHFRDLSLRRCLDAMPILKADAGPLPDECLLRAAAVLGMFAHAYHSVETFLPRGACPESIRAPWRTVRRRLGREEEVLTYIDNIVYNWRLVDPLRQDAMRLGNLRLLVPTVDTPEERIFYLTQTEILAQATPIVRAIASAQMAVLAEDEHQLLQDLGTIGATLRELRDRSLANIDPRPVARTFQNPVVWAKSVAPLSVPIHAGLHGPSGTNSPIFATLDLFFERKRYETILGQEMLALRLGYPRHWRQFLAAVAAVSVRAFVEHAASSVLSDAWNEALASYAGEAGLLGRHRMKVYGYMEVAFRVGRSVTIGGFAGRSGEKVWRRVDQELEAARRERLTSEAHGRTSRPARPSTTTDDGRAVSLDEVARHNDDAFGYWLVIGGEVYDVTDYLRAHPGGPVILKLYAGTDATEAFARVHARSEQVARLRAGLHIGRLEALDPEEASLAKALYLINSVQNSLRLDLSFQDYPAQSCDPGTTTTAYKLQRFVESHQRFFHNDLDTLRGGILSPSPASTVAEPWPPSSAELVLNVIVGLAAQVPHFQASGRSDVLAMLRASCVEIAAAEHAAIATTKEFLLARLRRGREGRPPDPGAQTETLARLADYLVPIRDSERFRTLRAVATGSTWGATAASPLWSDHEIMRLRPHQPASKPATTSEPEPGAPPCLSGSRSR